MRHDEAIRKIKEQVIPLLRKAKLCMDRNSEYVQRFEELCVYIEALLTEEQAGGGGAAETPGNKLKRLLARVREVLTEFEAEG